MASDLDCDKMPFPVVPANEETFVCLSGPCRWYWERTIPFGNGEHRQRLRHCTYGASMIDLTDNNVFTCNRHDPLRPMRRLLGVLGL
jgi:hypothetical protein